MADVNAYNPQGWSYDPKRGQTWSFFHAKLDAARLPFSELVSFAKVSTDNRHHCNSCFCCACVDVLRERSGLR